MAEAGNADPLRMLRALRERGTRVEFLWGNARCVLVADPDDISRALLDRQKSFARSGGPPRLARLLGEGLLRSQGDRHLRQRRLVQPAFVPHRMALYETEIAALAAAHARRIAGRRGACLHRYFLALMLDVVARVLFGERRTGAIRALGRRADTAIRCLPSSVGTREWLRGARFRIALAGIDAQIAGWVRSARSHASDRGDLLWALVHAHDENHDGAGMADTELRDEVATLLVAGHETTASALAWAGWLLSRHPGWQSELAEEARRGAHSLPLARAVMAETLRLYPPAWVLMRRAIRDYDERGLSIPAGHHLVVSPYLAGRDADLFPEPLEFRPERWLQGLEHRLPPGAYFPFGLGIRRCVGEHLAWIQATHAISALCRHAGFSPAGAPVNELPAFTLRPDRDVRVTIQRFPTQEFSRLADSTSFGPIVQPA